MSTRPRSAVTSPVLAMVSPFIATPPGVQGEPDPSHKRPFLNTTSKFGLRAQEMSAMSVANRRRERRISVLRLMCHGIRKQEGVRLLGEPVAVGRGSVCRHAEVYSLPLRIAAITRGLRRPC